MTRHLSVQLKTRKLQSPLKHLIMLRKFNVYFMALIQLKQSNDKGLSSESVSKPKSEKDLRCSLNCVDGAAGNVHNVAGGSSPVTPLPWKKIIRDLETKACFICLERVPCSEVLMTTLSSNCICSRFTLSRCTRRNL